RLATGRQIPEANRAIPGRGRQPSAICGKLGVSPARRISAPWGTPGEVPHHPARGHITNTNHSDDAGHGDAPAVGREGEVDRRSVPREREALAVAETPEVEPLEPAEVFLSRPGSMLLQQPSCTPQLARVPVARGDVHI